jgi:hypothetical protein
MPSAIKLSDEIVAIARDEAKRMKRSIAGQVEFWAELGRSVEAANLLDYERVRAALSGQGSVQGMTELETALYLELLGDEFEGLDGTDRTRIRKLEAAGHPVAGEDARGRLVVRKRRAAR